MPLAALRAPLGPLNRRGIIPINYQLRWGVVSYWKLEDLTDSVGTNTLTNNNAVGFTAGKLGNAAQFVIASNQNLSIADNASLHGGNVDWYWAWWSKPASINNVGQNIFSKFSGDVDYEAQAYAAGPNRYFTFAEYYNAGYKTVTIDNGSDPDPLAWHFHLVWFDSVAQTLNLRVNHGTVASTDVSAVAKPISTAGTLRIGARADVSSPFGGLIDAVIWGKSPPLGLTALAGEISSRLYNSGAGREMPWT